MLEPRNSTNSVRKMVLGIGAASLISLNITPSLIPEVHDRYVYQYECTSNYQCFYQLKHEAMESIVDQNAMESIIDVPKIKTIKVKFNKPERLIFQSVENDEGFLS